MSESSSDASAFGFWNLLLHLFGWAIVFGGGSFAVWDKRDPAVLGLILAAGFVTIVLSQLHRFEVLKGGGVEVQLRRVQAARKEVEEALAEAQAAQRGAEEAQEQTRRSAEELARMILEQLPFMGRLGGAPSTPENMASRDRMLALLDQIGVPPERREAAAAPFNEKMCSLLARRARGALAHAAYEKKDEPLSKSIRETGPLEAEGLAALMQEHDLATDGAQKALRVLRQFEATRTLSDEFEDK